MTPPRKRSANTAALEKHEQAAVRALYVAVGFVVVETSQPRASGITEGVPDLLLLHPGTGAAFWHETKRQKGGRVLPMQGLFRRVFEATGGEVIIGGADAARAQLLSLGLADTVDGVFVLRPQIVDLTREWYREQGLTRAKAKAARMRRRTRAT